MKNLKMIAVLCCVLTGFASCSEDDTEIVTATQTVNVAGTYEGYTVASSQYFSNMVAADQTVTLTATEAGKVDISYESDTWGTITINGALLNQENGSTVITGSGKSLMGMNGGTAKEYTCNVNGSLGNGVLNLTFSCPQIMGGLKIEYHQGTVPAALIVPGTYEGYTVAKSAYFDGMTAADQSLTITANDDQTFKVVFTSDTWGDITIEKAEAEYADGVFSLTGEGHSLMGMNGNINTYVCTLTGTVDTAKENPSFTFALPGVMGGLSIDFHTGEAPEATE